MAQIRRLPQPQSTLNIVPLDPPQREENMDQDMVSENSDPISPQDIKPKIDNPPHPDVRVKVQQTGSMTTITIQANVNTVEVKKVKDEIKIICLLYTSPSPRDLSTSRMPSSA